jgi:hypothetical protein
MSIANPTLDDIWKLFQETDKRWQETDKRWQETDRRFQQMREESEKQDKKLTEKIEKVSTDLGRLGNRLGEFIEEMVYPAAVRLFQERGIDIHEVYRNVSAKRNGEGIEIDLLVVNNNDVVAIECKSNLSIDDVNEHLARLEKIKRLLPAQATKNVMGAVTGMLIPDNVAQYAYKKGLFVIGQTGEQLVIRNDEKFKAKIW